MSARPAHEVEPLLVSHAQAAAREASGRSLMKRYLDWLKKAKATGKKLSSYDCPECEFGMHTPTPPKGDTFTSFTTCPNCDGAWFKTTYDNGTVTLRRIHPETAQ